jgi:hypothetical protein
MKGTIVDKNLLVESIMTQSKKNISFYSVDGGIIYQAKTIGDNFVVTWLESDGVIGSMLYSLGCARHRFFDSDWVCVKTPKELADQEKLDKLEIEKEKFVKKFKSNILCHFTHNGVEKQCISINNNQALVSYIHQTNKPYIISYYILILDVISAINSGEWIAYNSAGF